MPTRLLMAYADNVALARVWAGFDRIFEQAGAVVEVRRASEVESVDAYDSVILLGPLEGGLWSREAEGFLQRFRLSLGRMPIAYVVDCALASSQVRRALRPLLDAYCEIRPISILELSSTRIHLDRADAWAKALVPTLIGSPGAGPSGIRPFLRASRNPPGDLPTSAESRTHR